MKIFPINEYQYSVPDQPGMGSIQKLQWAQLEAFKLINGRKPGVYAKDDAGNVIVDDKGIPVGWDVEPDEELATWLQEYSQHPDVQRLTANAMMTPVNGAPPLKDIYDEADPQQVAEAILFFVEASGKKNNGPAISKTVSTKRRSSRPVKK